MHVRRARRGRSTHVLHLDAVVAAARASTPARSQSVERRSTTIVSPSLARRRDRERLVDAVDACRARRAARASAAARPPATRASRVAAVRARARGGSASFANVNATSTSASACWPKRVSPTVRSAATRAAHGSAPARDARSARPPRRAASSVDLAAPPASRSSRRGTTSRTVAVSSRVERVAHGRPRARPSPPARDRRAVRLDPRAEALRAEVAPRAAAARACSSASARAVGERAGRGSASSTSCGKPVAADDQVRPQRAVELGARDEVVDAEAVAVLVVEDVASGVGRLLVAGRERRAGRRPRTRSRPRRACAPAAGSAVSSYSCQRDRLAERRASRSTGIGSNQRHGRS